MYTLTRYYLEHYVGQIIQRFLVFYIAVFKEKAQMLEMRLSLLVICINLQKNFLSHYRDFQIQIGYLNIAS